MQFSGVKGRQERRLSDKGLESRAQALCHDGETAF